MASESDVERWKAAGGSLQETTSGKRVTKTWVASDGKRFRSWKEACAFLDGDQNGKATPGGRKRANTSPDVAKDQKDADAKRQKTGKQRKKQPADDKVDTAADGDAIAATAEDKPADAEDSPAEPDAAAPAAAKAVGSGRAAAQGKKYKEKKGNGRLKKADMIEHQDEKEAETEPEAWQETQTEGSSTSTRRLLHFSIINAEDEPQMLERLDIIKEPFNLTGAVYPADGPLDKAKGRLLSKPFGPITSWHIHYTSSGATPVAVTAQGSYLLSKPDTAYRKVFAGLEEQAGLAWHVLQALEPSFGGSPSASLDAVVVKLTRAKAGKGYSSAREALLLNGRFVLAQLSACEARKAGGAAALDKGKGKAGISAGPFVTELQAELAKGPVRVGLANANGGITIKDVSAEARAAEEEAAAAAGADGKPDALMEADEDYARRLQAKMDAKTMAGNKGRGQGAARGGGNAYIKISEFEIADDYPMPQQYKAPADVEETDELLLWDEEMADVDPELLPKRLITDFSIYNGEGFFASLELLPMWAGVDPDVELFASGIVKDDEGDWGTGGQPLVVRTTAADTEGQQQNDDTQQQQDGADSGAAAAGGSSKAGGSSDAPEQEAAGSNAAAEAAAEADASPDPVAEGGMRLFLSQIREWVVEYSADMLFISIRTDAAWYKLCRPNPKYAPWFNVPLKSARVAVSVINMLEQQSRASRLSFADIVKKLSEEPQSSNIFISKKAERVERFLVVHGQILLNQIKVYPSKEVQRSPFVTSLKQKMEARRHSKLYYSKRGFSKAPTARAVNRNPMKDRASSAKAKPMPATTTSMVRSIWQNYFYAMEEQKQQGEAAAAAEEEANGAAGGSSGAGSSRNGGTVGAAAVQQVAQEVEDDPLEEDQQDEEDDREEALAETAAPPTSPAKRRRRLPLAQGKKQVVALKEPKAKREVTWVGSPTSQGDKQLYSSTQVAGVKVQPGCVVLLEPEEGTQAAAGQSGSEQHQQYALGLVQCMWQDEDGDKLAQVRVLVHGSETVLGDAAADAELFVTDDFEEVYLHDVAGLAKAKQLQREFDHEQRLQHFKDDEALRKRNAEAKAAGRPLEYFFRHLYLPKQGMFSTLPADLEVGTYHETPDDPVALGLLGNNGSQGFIKNGVEYKVGDFLFVDPAAFDEVGATSSSSSEASQSEAEEEEEDEEEETSSGKKDKSDVPAYAKKRGRFHKGSIAGLRAWAVARLVEVKQPPGNARRQPANGNSSSSSGSQVPSKLLLQRYFRPEEIGKDVAYRASFWDLYASPAAEDGSEADSVQWSQWLDVKHVIRKCSARGVGQPVPEGADGLDCFDIKGTYDPDTKEVSDPPADFEAAAEAMDVDTAAAEQQNEGDAAKTLAMATMDIFAGCGGLSEGMHQAHVADTKWAIEYEAPAADAFKLNNPEAAVFCNNCNVILVSAMQKAGLTDDCLACDDARTAATCMSAEEIERLPRPGEVEFIMGGPPCQGYSGMNRFNKGNWSMVQNSMVMAFLSYCDFYRPRYFLLENVRNFVSHNKSFTFRLTLRTLLDMGYQVRFGVLNAGNYGVPQSRKRTFIWAAAPDELLPDWPTPKHVFRSPQLTVNLPGGVAYCAVDTSLPAGAPLRTVTVRDAIGDLPPIENGHNQAVMEYTKPPESAYQKAIRGKATQLQDHICKEMNPLNLERCRCIPKETPGADWRVLQDIVKNDPSREKFEGQPLVPWCLPNTADRHNGWRGLFGRLDLDGHFPTSTTDPQPMGKVGQVFHPNQDRIVSVRECARSQGFPDHFNFSGNVHSRHRQVGNAVPPPLAASLGRQLRTALQKKQQRGESDMLW